jgi:tetratricopeptide (TPR) repeat protein
VRRSDGRAADPAGQLLFEFAADGEAPAAQASIEIHPQDESLDDDRAFAEAVELERRGRLREARDAYQRWLLERGPDARVCFNLGNVLSSLGKIEAAVERYRQAVELDPHFAEGWNNLGQALADLGRPGACDAWRRAVQADADCGDALFNLADALQEEGRPDEARPYWEAFLRCDFQSAWADYARERLKQGAGRRDP